MTPAGIIRTQATKQASSTTIKDRKTDHTEELEKLNTHLHSHSQDTKVEDTKKYNLDTPDRAETSGHWEMADLWGINQLDTSTEDPQFMEDTTPFKQMNTLELLQVQTENNDLMRAHLVQQKGYPNRYGARIPVHTSWNLNRLEQLLQDYHDKEVVEWLCYGWPTGRLPNMAEPQKTYKNHKGATDFPEALQKYIEKEIKKGAVMGPFEKIPFKNKVGISPISTRPKKTSEERRVIIDLSFPVGQAVNDGMIKDNYMGHQVSLSFPKVDDLALRIYRLGKAAMMFKIDLSRYFRQIPLDPGDYSMLGYIIHGKLYFDKVLPMGMRTAPYIAQRVTNAICHIHHKLQFYLLKLCQ